MLKKFCEVSSCNGVVDLYEAKNSKCQFAFWAMVMTSMLGASTYFTYATIRGYVDTPSVTNVETVQQKFPDFPEIMIMYNGGMNISAMLAANLSPSLVKAFASQLRIEPTDDNNEELKMFRLTHNLSMKETYKKFSYRCDEMVHSFLTSNNDSPENPTQCDKATEVWVETGISYLFHDTGKQETVMGGGMAIELKELPLNFQNIYSNVKLMKLQITNDYSIFIQKTFDNQFIFDGMILIPLHSLVNIVLHPKRYVRLPKSTRCDSRNETYSSNTCIQNCEQAAFVESCKCRTLMYGSDAKLNPIDYCSLETEWSCAINDSFRAQCMDSCLPKCDEWVFEYQTSMKMFSKIDMEERSKSYVYIFYDRMMYIKIEEVEAFTMDMAVANVGGQCGLWLGASFVTIIQAVYYLLLAVAEKITKKKEAKVSVLSSHSKEGSE